MITCTLMGGLGNQLFQIFAIIAYCLQHRIQFKFLYSTNIPSITPRHSYWESFLKSLKFFTVTTLPNNLEKIIVPTGKHIPLSELNKSNNKNVIFHGYFQSYKFFDDEKNDIFRLIRLADLKKDLLMKMDFPNMENTISLHFRLGDYKHLSHTHPIMSVNYYINALTHILSKSTEQKYKVYYFCEEEDNSFVKETYISPISQIFPSLKFEKVDDKWEDWKQVIFMSCCKHNIIANSTFSWFGAYFNTTSPQPIVCYPHIWFAGETASHVDTSDLFPPQWIKITC